MSDRPIVTTNLPSIINFCRSIFKPWKKIEDMATGEWAQIYCNGWAYRKES